MPSVADHLCEFCDVLSFHPFVALIAAVGSGLGCRDVKDGFQPTSTPQMFANWCIPGIEVMAKQFQKCFGSEAVAFIWEYLTAAN